MSAGEGGQKGPVAAVADDLDTERPGPELAARREVEVVHAVAGDHPHPGAAAADGGLDEQVPRAALVEQVGRLEASLGVAPFQARFVAGGRAGADRPVVLPRAEVG